MIYRILPLVAALLLVPSTLLGGESGPEEAEEEQLQAWGPERPVFGVSLGLGRSWTGDLQASSIRVALGGHRPWMLAGVEADWATDNRWRPKARSYQRVHFRVFAALDLAPFPGATIWIGAGGGAGIWRGGPAASRQVQPAAGLFEFVQLNIHIKQGLMGVRIEQQQTWQPDSVLPEDHVTAFLFMVGGIVDI